MSHKALPRFFPHWVPVAGRNSWRIIDTINGGMVRDSEGVALMFSSGEKAAIKAEQLTAKVEKRG